MQTTAMRIILLLLLFFFFERLLQLPRGHSVCRGVHPAIYDLAIYGNICRSGACVGIPTHRPGARTDFDAMAADDILYYIRVGTHNDDIKITRNNITII